MLELFFDFQCVKWIPDLTALLKMVNSDKCSKFCTRVSILFVVMSGLYSNFQLLTPDYYMATIVRPLWLAAEWALFSCNDRALWNFSRLFWVASKSNERVGENNKKDGQKVVQLYFQ